MTLPDKSGISFEGSKLLPNSHSSILKCVEHWLFRQSNVEWAAGGGDVRCMVIETMRRLGTFRYKYAWSYEVVGLMQRERAREFIYGLTVSTIYHQS